MKEILPWVSRIWPGEENADGWTEGQTDILGEAVQLLAFKFRIRFGIEILLRIIKLKFPPLKLGLAALVDEKKIPSLTL